MVSDETDDYLEQALISITSLKMRMPEAFVSLLIDDTTEKSLTDKRKNILELVNELKVVEIDSQFNKKARSRWLKTSMRRYIEGDFLFIDCDTVICEDLSEIENLGIDLGAVLDCHLLIHDHSRRDFFKNSDKLLGFESSLKTDKHFNSGVIYCKDITVCHAFFEEWHRLWLFGIKKRIIDQTSFNQANFNLNNIMAEMDGIWNCQICSETRSGGLAFLANAKIIHYFGTRIDDGPYTLANHSLFQKIKFSGSIDNDIKKLLLSPKTNFNLRCYILSDNKIIEILKSPLFVILKRIYDWRLIQSINKLLIKWLKSRQNKMII